MRGTRPISSCAVRRRPNSCTSSAPKVDTPTSVTHTGRCVTASISAMRRGHSSICQWFQSSGKPCTATASSPSSTPRSRRLAMKCRIDRRDAAEHLRERAVLRAHGGEASFTMRA
jgi:hypothetical protein